MTDARQYLGVIALDLHAPTPTISELTASQLVVDQFVIDGQSGGQSFNDRDERSPV
jgi:hypothetical protein